MKKKILIYMKNLAGGGAERTIVNIINYIDKSKFDIILAINFDDRNEYLYLLDNSVRIITLQSKRLRHTILELRKIIITEKPDLLFSTLNMNNIVLMLSKLISLRTIPVVLREANNRTQSGEVTLLNRILTRILYNKADAIISLSKGVAEDLTKNFKINHKKIHVIYNLIDLVKINELKDEKITDLEINKKEKLLISVGKLTEQKDFPTLLKAFKIVREYENAKLIILGKGSDEKYLKELTNKLGIKNQVYFIGFKKNPYKYMKSADVFILTSKWEGFGHVIVESMAVGTPVIATDCKSGPSEIIKNNEYGMLVPVGDYKAIARRVISLLNDEKIREKYINKGLKRSRDFDARNIVKHYENLFLKLIRKV